MLLFSLCTEYSEDNSDGVGCDHHYTKVLVFAKDESDARLLASKSHLSSHGEKWLDKSITECAEIPIVAGIVDF